MRSWPIALSLCVAPFTGCAGVAGGPAATGTLTVGYEVPVICNGIAVAPGGGRAFLSYPKADGGGGATLVEIESGTNKQTAYPDVDANSWQPGDDAHAKFVRVNSLRFGPDGNLWVIDIGTPGPQQPPVPGGPKLVAIDIKTNRVVKTIFLDGVAKSDAPGGKGNSFFDDFRFGDKSIYVTDAGAPALVVVDIATGRARRVLENHPSTVARAMYAEGKKLTKPNGEPVAIHADQLEVSPDGTILYYCPCSGPTSRIETKYMDDATLSDAELATHVRPFYDNPTIGGTCIDDQGRVYFDDADHQRVTRVTPDGRAETVVEDKSRLHWGDAMYIDDAHNLWIPAAQMERTPGMNHTLTTVEWPIKIYKLRIDAGPVRR